MSYFIKPDEPEKPSEPETSTEEETTPSTEESNTKPVAVKLDETVITAKAEEAKQAAEGTTLVVEMKKENGEVATEVPVAVLEAVKGKDVNIVLDMGGYSWTINGKDVLATDLQAINLEVKMDTEAVAPSVVDLLAGGEPTRQLSLTHEGDFGFKASLTINVGNEHEGEFGNLYYHDSNGKLIFMNAGKIDADGNVSLDFSHASDYVVVIGRDRTEEEAAKLELETEAETELPQNLEETVDVTTSEDGGNGLLIVLAIIALAAVVIYITVNKKKKM